MSLVGNIARGFTGRASAGVPSYGMIPPLGSIQSVSGLSVSQATAMTVGAVYAAVTIRATDVARCKPSLYSTDADGTLTKETKQPVAKLLKRPNRVQTWFEFMRDLWIAFLLRGNGYAVILRDRRGDPTELILVNPDAVMVLESVDGQWFYNVNRIGLFQMDVLRDLPIAIPAEDVLHFRGPSFNMLVGVSTIGLARDTIGLAIGQSQQQSRWLGAGARPSMVLQTDRKLTPAAADRLKASWKEFQAGLQNVGGTAVLEEGLKATQMSLSAVDLQYIEQIQMTVRDVGNFFKVPARKLGLPDVTRGSTIMQEEQAYVNSTVSPDLDMIEQKFDWAFDLDAEGLSLDLNEDALLRADPLTRYNLGRIGKLSGLIKTNEWRKSERLPPEPGGDVLMQPVNMAALGSDVSGTPGDGAGRPPAGSGAAETGNEQPEAPEG